MVRKIAYVTDLHIDEKFPIEQGVNARENWNMVLHDIKSKGIKDIVVGGDIGEKESNNWFFESLQSFNVNISLGNHDYYNEVIKYFNFENSIKRSELYYSRMAGNFKFIFLDSSSESISKKQFDWFKDELKTPYSIFIFIHHPILEVDAEVDKRFSLKERNLLKNELLSIENDITIFSGHYHFEDYTIVKNIKQYITPAVSYQVEKIAHEIKVHNRTFGYRIIEIDDMIINGSVILFS